MAYSGLITAAQLREEIGGLSTVPDDASYVADEQLQSIIDRAVATLTAGLDARLRQMELDEVRSLIRGYAEEIEVVLQPDLRYAKGEIPDTYAPIYIDARDAEGRTLDYDNHIDQTAAVALFTKRRIRFVGQTIQVLPREATSASLYLATKAAAREALASREGMVVDLNKMILSEARKMRDDRVKRFKDDVDYEPRM